MNYYEDLKNFYIVLLLIIHLSLSLLAKQMITTYFRERTLINRQKSVKILDMRPPKEVPLLYPKVKRSLTTHKGLKATVRTTAEVPLHFLNEAPPTLPPCCPLDGVDTTALGTKFRQKQISSFPQCFQQNALIGWELSESYRKLLEQELAFLLIWICMPSSKKRANRRDSYSWLYKN